MLPSPPMPLARCGGLLRLGGSATVTHGQAAQHVAILKYSRTAIAPLDLQRRLQSALSSQSSTLLRSTADANAPLFRALAPQKRSFSGSSGLSARMTRQRPTSSFEKTESKSFTLPHEETEDLAQLEGDLRKPPKWLRLLAALLGIPALFFGGAFLSARESWRLDDVLHKRVGSLSPGSILQNFVFNFGKARDRLLEEVYRHERAEQIGDWDRAFFGGLKSLPLPGGLADTVSHQVLRASEWLVNLPTWQAAIVPYLAANITIYLLWKVPAPGFQAFMRQNFLDFTRAGQGRIRNMMTSAFSHKTLPHLAFNTIALFSVGSLPLALAAKHMQQRSGSGTTREETLPEVNYFYKLMTFVLLCALASSRASRLYKQFIASRIVGNPKVSATVQRFGIYSSGLGASGVAYGLFAGVAITQPEARFKIIFLPAEWGTLDGSTLMKILVTADALLLLLPFRTGLDHAAHLGGAFFGWLWFSGLDLNGRFEEARRAWFRIGQQYGILGPREGRYEEVEVTHDQTRWPERI